MAKRLKMAKAQAIIVLHERGWHGRRIAQELGINRETVAKYIRAATCAPKPAKAPLGSEIMEDEGQGGSESILSTAFLGEEERIAAEPASPMPGEAAGISKPAKAPLGPNSKPAKAPLGSEALFGGIDPVEP